ncbi:hypothetical protein NP493_664g02127 [Ridgeia piscesae]|uniref:Uncharacterized protein n=1 Tax=Ridgeia piscesae TaxID=27915 RepID=A0AAD9KRY8_RIDPI|nr:hypothetical protein NP493_664g02127 [Ridgeia piscesae]
MVGMKKLTTKVEATKRKKAMDHVAPTKKQPCLESFFKTST